MSDELFVTVKVRIPARAFWKLSQLAVKHDTDSGSLVWELARRQLCGPVRVEPVRRGGKQVWLPEHDEELTRLHGEGLLDADIGKRMGFEKSTIRTHRSELGLPALVRGRPRRDRKVPA